jgi:hypothetical protein
MDVRVEQSGELATVKVDLMQDAANFRNDADVEADVYFVAAGAVGSSMEALTKVQLSQTGPGHYEASFTPNEPGVYLVRARSGADVVSAGLVHNTSVETATGQVDQRLFESVTRITSGKIIDAAATNLPTIKESHAHFVELTPLLLRIFLVLFIIDIAIRRWDNVMSIATVFRRN